MGQGSIENDLAEAEVGLGAESKEVGQDIHCNRGKPKPIHDHSRSRAEARLGVASRAKISRIDSDTGPIYSN